MRTLPAVDESTCSHAVVEVLVSRVRPVGAPVRGLHRHAHAMGTLVVLAVLVAIPVGPAARGIEQDPPGGCTVSGAITDGADPLPGAFLVLTSASLTSADRSSTREDGGYRLVLHPNVPYRITASLPGFADVSRDVVVTRDACHQRLDLTMTLAPLISGPRDILQAASADWQPPAPAAGESRPEHSDVAAALGLPIAILSRMLVGTAEFDGGTIRPDRGWVAERQRTVARAAALPAPTSVDAAAAPQAAASKPAGATAAPAPRTGTMVKAAMPQRAYQGSVTYALNGSALDSAPYQLRPDRLADSRPYNHQSFWMSLSGPLRLPRTASVRGRGPTFTFTYSGSRGSSLFDQYATVPTDAIRAGDFSAVSWPLIDPTRGEPFANRRIPDERIHPAARALLRFIPAPNLPGTTRNFQYTTTSASRSNAMTLKVAHQLRQPPAGPKAPARLAASLIAQLDIRRNRADQVNVFPALGGASRTSAVAVPVTVNLQRGRDLHVTKVDVSASVSRAESRYAGVEDVAAVAGIAGLAREPFTWGVPVLSFATYSSARDVNPTRRQDRRLSLGYAWTRTTGRHTVTAGADGRFDWSDNQTDPNARGTFVFTGRHTAGTARVPRGAGFDFADFLLGLPEQASVQYGPGRVRIRGRALSVYAQDDWRRTSGLTLTLGVRYELVWPFIEASRQMVNLDVAPDFARAVPVVSGAAGPFTGIFPAGLLDADTNNIAPRLAVAWKAPRALTLRAGYGVSYNSGPYSTIARQLVSQPPFAASHQSVGSVGHPLDLADPFRQAEVLEAARTFGADRDYAIGRVQTWNAELSRPFRTIWTASGSYTGKRGTSLDLIRTPNRDPAVTDFRWQTSDGRSMMHGMTVRVQRRKTRGLGGTVSYSLARSRDNMAVAQNDQDLGAEWSLSSFDRRHQLSCDIALDLPFGPNRRWMNRGRWAPLVAGWSATARLTAQSGSPLTPRVTGAQAANRPMRPDDTGEPIQLESPTIDLFFNTAAFTLPEGSQFGTAGRNVIIGPGSRLLDATLARDLRLGTGRTLTVQLTALNLLNLVNYSAVNTTVNSSAFGQVTSVRPMRTMTLSFKVGY